MTTTLASVQTPADAELIAAVRDGDTDAYGELFRRHVEAARRLARQLVAGPDVDDLVSEAFAKVLALLQRGAGPDLAFRAYLLTAVRRLHVDRLRAAARLQPTDDLTPFDPGVPFRDTAVEGFENDAAARAFASLPERWQLVLWHTEVEGQRPAEVAPLLGLSPNSVSALAYRAREGLRQAFLSMHAQDTADAACAWTHEHLGAYVRGGLSRRDAARVEEHVGGCHRCAAVWLELDDLNQSLAGVLAPVLLGTAAAAYVGSGLGGSAAGAGGVLGLLSRLRDAALAHGPATAAAGLAAGAAVVSGALLWPDHQPVRPLPDSATAEVRTPAVRTHPPRHVPPTRLRPEHRSPGQGRSHQPAAQPSSPPSSPPLSSPPLSPAAGPTPGAAPVSSPATVTAPAPAGPAGGPSPDPGASPSGDRSDVDLRVTVEGLPPGSSTSVAVGADTGLLGDHPIRRRIVVGSSG